MQSIFGFLTGLFWLVVGVVVLLGFLAFRGYNGLRLLSENVKEAWSNIGVTIGKQASLINQLIAAVNNHAEGEKLVMLKVSQDASVGAVQQLHQQGGLMLSAVNGMMQRFPDLKASTQFSHLMDAITQVENQLEHQRQAYNAATKAYNVRRTSIPDVFYAKVLGFASVPYLDFDGASARNPATLNAFVTEDNARLNHLLAGNTSPAVAAPPQAAAATRPPERQIATVDFAVDAPDAADATVIGGRPARLHLVDVGGTANGQTFEVRPLGMVIGRATTADIVVQDNQVSKQHAWIGRTEGRWLLRDQSSSNGTFIDSAPTTRVTEIALTTNTEILLGAQGTRFRVVID